MQLSDIALTTIDGEAATFGDYESKAVLVVNVASRCGFTPQYAGLEKLYEQYGERGLTILGFPCNQFMFQEPGSNEDIKEFCSTNYDVTFPLFDKIHVNGKSQHPLYAELTKVADAEGKAGKVKWNFEKFLVSGDGEIHRFRSDVEPESPEVIDAIEGALASAAA
ncbi:MAG TPA: glutathione peroxidase [Terrimesophilobacter sp.]|uniref:glutathione peroxidase n=1 Tax=Terrimesophilobacter sp. TaxID=2906435 RepID=UPI002F942C9A